MTTATPTSVPLLRTAAVRWLAAGATVVALAAGCSDDDAEPTPPSGESEVDGSEADVGDSEGGSSTSGGTTGGGTEGNQEVDDPGQPEPTTEATAQDTEG